MPRNKTVLMYVTRAQVVRAYNELSRNEAGGYMFSAEPIESREKSGIEKFEAMNPELKEQFKKEEPVT